MTGKQTCSIAAAAILWFKHSGRTWTWKWPDAEPLTTPLMTNSAPRPLWRLGLFCAAILGMSLQRLIPPAAGVAACIVLLAAIITRGIQVRFGIVLPAYLRPSGAAGRGVSEPGRRWLFGGFAVTAFGLAAVEWIQPYYFSQDDNFAQFLPVILQGCRSLFSGVFPAWDPYQWMGAPTTVVGTYALTYPVTYLSYFIARYVLHNEYFTLEVFCILHLLLGYGATFAAARAVGIRPSLACAGSVSFILSGYVLIAGRSWYYMVPVALWAPLLALSAVHLAQGKGGWKWVMWTGAGIGLFFHAGNAQMWVYAVGFWLIVIGLLWWNHSMPRRHILWVIPALLLGAAIAAPLAIPQAIYVTQLARAGGGGEGISRGILTMLLPYPLVQAKHPNGWGSTDIQFMGQFYYAGTLFTLVTLAFLLGMVGYLAAYRCRYSLVREILAGNPWLLCALLSFIIALGPEGGLWPAMSELPGFKLFTGPFKLLEFFHLFAVLGGGLILETWLQYRERSSAWSMSLAGAVLVLMFYSAVQSRPSFFTYGDTPYPALPPALSRLLSPQSPNAGRTITLAPPRNIATGYVFSLQHNWPSVYQVKGLEGYDPFVGISPQNMLMAQRTMANPLAALKAYGVHWILVGDPADDQIRRPNPWLTFLDNVSQASQGTLEKIGGKAAPVLDLPSVSVWKVPDPSPMAFYSNAPLKPLPVHWTGTGVRVDLTGRGGRVIINVLCRKDLHVVVNGQPAQCRADNWGRVFVSTQPGAQQVVLQYDPPWDKGFLAAAGLLFLTLLTGVAAARCASRPVTEACAETSEVSTAPYPLTAFVDRPVTMCL